MLAKIKYLLIYLGTVVAFITFISLTIATTPKHKPAPSHRPADLQERALKTSSYIYDTKTGLCYHTFNLQGIASHTLVPCSIHVLKIARRM